MHPFSKQAHETSKGKAHALLGQKGGGNIYMGSAMSAKAGPDGAKNDWHGHSKTWQPAGARSKGRADRFANGGRAPRADGGRLDPISSAGRGMSRPSGMGQSRRSVRRGKIKGDVNINVNPPPPRQQNMPMMPPIPPGPPPGGPPGMPPGGPPGMPPGMPPPGPPPGLPPGGAMPPPGGPPPGMPPGGPPPGMPPGMPPGGPPPNPMAAQQALAAIAGGAGPMGAGMPGRGPFKRGGRAHKIGGGPAGTGTKRMNYLDQQNLGMPGEAVRMLDENPDIGRRDAISRVGTDSPMDPSEGQKRGGRMHKAGGGKVSGLASNLDHWRKYASGREGVSDKVEKPMKLMPQRKDGGRAMARGGRNKFGPFDSPELRGFKEKYEPKGFDSGLREINRQRKKEGSGPTSAQEIRERFNPRYQQPDDEGGMARGGRLTAGAETGIGREEKASRARKAGH